MMVPTLPPGHVRALLERPRDPTLIAAANELIRGGDPTDIMRSFPADKVPSDFTIDPTFGSIPIGRGAQHGAGEDLQSFLQPEISERFLVSGFLRVNRDRVPEYFGENGERYPIHSNPPIGGLQRPGQPPPCLPTCGTSQYVGTASDVQQKLCFQTLQDNGLNGSGVALAIVDSGIYKRRIEQLLGDALKPPRPINLDVNNSWRPSKLVTEPGNHRVGHGTMCAYDALIMAPKATLVDIPMLLARPVADHHTKSMVDAALHAYFHLAIKWFSGSFDALVVSNSWGIFHPSLEDFPPGHRHRFIDNPNHAFHLYFTRPLAAHGVDIIFCGNNCGDGTNCAGHCASGTCLSKTDRMIMGANTYQEVLTIGGCDTNVDTNHEVVGYSSRGPSIHHMFQHKPDLVAYTHFLGSKTVETFVPDTGVSAACPVAAGCVAALRTRVRQNAVSPADLFQTLRNTARKPAGGGAGWTPDFGYGIIDPVAAGRALGVIP
jgi:hypothetical protein